MDKAFDVITALDVCVDFLVIGSPIPQFGQAEQLVEDYEIEMGGSAVIFASQCAKLGLRTTGAGRVGPDAFGQLFLEKLAATGVDLSAIVRDDHAKTGVGILLCRQNDRAILTYNGTIDGVSRDMVAAQLPRAGHLHIASYYLMATLRPAWPDLARQAKAQGMTVSLDTNWDPAEQWQGIDDLAGSVDIFMPNENEARAFTGESDLDAAITRLGEKFPVVVIKLGSAGAMAICQGQISRVPGYPGVPVDTVGAGDNFDAGFIYGWLQEQPIERCLELGCFCGSRSIRERGGFAAQPRRKDILQAFPQLPEEMRLHR